MKILLSCLEPSANLHLGEVLKRLPGAEILGIFDERFGEPFMSSGEFSAMGFIEVLPLIFKAKRAMKKMVELARECDAVLLIDSPAFNLPLARKIKEAGARAPITYYILPQVWAWKRGRVALVEKYCDNLASILPFDAKFYSRATYVGHPLLDEIKFQKTGENLSIKERERGENFSGERNLEKIAFLPGSRRAEISRLMPVYREVSSKLNAKKTLVVPPFFMDKIAEIYGDTSGFEIATNAPETLKESDFAFICSGTATLEAALIGTPFTLCYKARAIDIFIARKLVKVAHAGLANIMFDFMGEPPLHEELIQEAASAENLLAAYERCDRAKFAAGCVRLRDYLKCGSAEAVAKILLKKDEK